MSDIVVIDDNESTQAMLRAFCAERGRTIATCTKGAEAFDLVLREQPRLVFLDIWLETRTTGWEILERLKESPATRHIPVVLASAWRDDLQDHRPLIAEAAAAVLVKPFSIEDVDRCLDFALTGTPGT